jgi:hypothetical protein
MNPTRRSRLEVRLSVTGVTLGCVNVFGGIVCRLLAVA